MTVPPKSPGLLLHNHCLQSQAMQLTIVPHLCLAPLEPSPVDSCEGAMSNQFFSDKILGAHQNVLTLR